MERRLGRFLRLHAEVTQHADCEPVLPQANPAEAGAHGVNRSQRRSIALPDNANLVVRQKQPEISKEIKIAGERAEDSVVLATVSDTVGFAEGSPYLNSIWPP